MSLQVERLAQRLAQRTPSEIDPPPREQAAVAVILAPADGQSGIGLLLIQRATRVDDPWSGHMALPGGRRDPGDSELFDTAVREAREEIGVDLREARSIGRLDDLRPIRQSERSLMVRPYVFWSSNRPELSLSGEVAEAIWVPLARLRAASADADVQHRGAMLRVPAFVIEDRIVWGLTQRVLTALLALEEGRDWP